MNPETVLKCLIVCFVIFCVIILAAYITKIGIAEKFMQLLIATIIIGYIGRNRIKDYF
jgi:hypothetical protein